MKTSWKTLLTDSPSVLTLPWIGGSVVRHGALTWKLNEELPIEHGWYEFTCLSNRKIGSFTQAAFPNTNILTTDIIKGYLVGDRIISDEVNLTTITLTSIIEKSERVHLLEEGLDRFVRIVAARWYEGGPLVYKSLEMPFGAEEAVLDAFLNESKNLNTIKNVKPALEAAFFLETLQREETTKRRLELEKLRKEEEARVIAEARYKELLEKSGSAINRRELAKTDFGEAAKAALAIGGAVYLDHRKSGRKNEFVVKFRLDGRRYECVTDSAMRLIDSGLCLDNHRGIKGDTWLTLESFSSVIREAIKLNKLVVYRHVD